MAKLKKVSIRQSVLTAIGYLLPLVVAAGLLIAIGNLCGGQYVTKLEGMTVPDALTTVGVFGMGLIPSFIAGYIAYSIADRPGLAPGFLMGQIETYLKVPKWAEALMPMMIIPTVTAIIGALLMFFVLGGPITFVTKALENFITGLDQSSKVLYGFIIGFIGCLDYGGAISKVPNLICDGLLAQGITGPEGIKVLAAMVPPFGVSLAAVIAHFIKRPIFTEEEIEGIKIAFPMGACMISEGVIPIAMNDLARTVVCTATGCGVCGAISFAFGNGSPVPSGGVFVIPAMSEPLVAVAALLAGSLVTAIMLVAIKKRIDPNAVQEKKEEEVDLSSLSFS